MFQPVIKFRFNEMDSLIKNIIVKFILLRSYKRATSLDKISEWILIFVLMKKLHLISGFISCNLDEIMYQGQMVILEFRSDSPQIERAF